MDVKLRESRERQFCNKKYTNAFVNGIPCVFILGVMDMATV